MTETLTSTGLFAVVLTLGTYEVGLWLRKKTGNALCNPLLISIILVMAALGLLKIPAETYGARMDLRHCLPCAGHQPGGRDFGAHGSGQLPVSCCGGDPDGDLLPCLVLPGGINEKRIEGVESYA